MTNPIDVIVKTISDNRDRSTRGLAESVACALVHDRIVDSAVRALLDDAWEGHPDPLTVEDLRAIATAVLGSVGGA